MCLTHISSDSARISNIWSSTECMSKYCWNQNLSRNLLISLYCFGFYLFVSQNSGNLILFCSLWSFGWSISCLIWVDWPSMLTGSSFAPGSYWRRQSRRCLICLNSLLQYLPLFRSESEFLNFHLFLEFTMNHQRCHPGLLSVCPPASLYIVVPRKNFRFEYSSSAGPPTVISAHIFPASGR